MFGKLLTYGESRVNAKDSLEISFLFGKQQEAKQDGRLSGFVCWQKRAGGRHDGFYLNSEFVLNCF